MDEKEVTIRLTVPEFVVLDEFLRRFSDTDKLEILHPAERRSLWNLQCIFERESTRDESWPSLGRAREVLTDDPADGS